MLYIIRFLRDNRVRPLLFTRLRGSRLELIDVETEDWDERDGIQRFG